MGYLRYSPQQDPPKEPNRRHNQQGRKKGARRVMNWELEREGGGGEIRQYGERRKKERLGGGAPKK